MKAQTESTWTMQNATMNRLSELDEHIHIMTYILVTCFVLSDLYLIVKHRIPDSGKRSKIQWLLMEKMLKSTDYKRVLLQLEQNELTTMKMKP